MLGDDEELIQFSTVGGKHIVESFGANDEACGVKVKVDHAGMRLAVDKNQLTEISIISDENPLLGDGDRENLSVLQIARMIGANAGDIVALAAQVGDHASIGAGIDQKSHTCAC